MKEILVILIVALADRWSDHLILVRVYFEEREKFENPTKEKASERIRELVNGWFENYHDFELAIYGKNRAKMQEFMKKPMSEYITNHIVKNLVQSEEFVILDFFIKEAGINPHIKENAINRRELIVAIRFRDAHKVKALLEKGIYVKRDDVFRDVPLIDATEKRNKYIMELLINAGAQINEGDFTGQTPLMALITSAREHVFSYQFQDDLHLIDFLISEGADINKRDFNGETALMYAIRWNYATFIKRLLTFNPNLNIRNNDGQTALDLAQAYDRTHIVELLDQKIRAAK